VFIAERKLFDSDRPMRPGDKAKFTFKGEGEIMRELKFLTEGRKKRKIYILQGNEEVDMSDNEIDIRQDFRTPFAKMGVGLLVDRLVADNYEVLGLSFNPPAGNKNPKIEFAKEGPDKKKSIPPDCHTLIVAGVSKALPDEALKAIERYLDHGNGKMLVFVDVVADDTYSKVLNSGIEGLLKDYGVEVTNEFLIRIPDRQLPDPRALLGTPPRRSENPLAREFLGRGLLIRQSARVIRPAEGRFGFKGETILQVPAPSDQSLLVQKDAKVLNITEMVRTIKDLQDDDRKRGEVGAREPASVAVAVADKDGKPRMVVFGDTEFITNLDISRGQRINYALTVSALDWMAERETIGTQPDERSTVALDPTVSADFWRIILVPLWLMMLTCIGLGVAFWLVRRR
jgi:hypothetical protein